MSEQPMTRCEFDASELLLRLDVTMAADREAVGDLIERIMETVIEMVRCGQGIQNPPGAG